MKKLEECARAAFDRHKYKYPERWEDLIPNIRESYIDDTRAVIRCLMELSDRDVNRCHNEPTMNNIAYYRAMLQSVLDESKE